MMPEDATFDKSDHPVIGRHLAVARKKAKFTQKELAARLEVSQSQISSFESGKRDSLSNENVLKIMEFLQVDLEALTETEQIVARLCPNENCPTVKVMFRGGKLTLRPCFFLDNETYCPACGTVLISECRKKNCHVPIDSRRLCCRGCGTPYLIPTECELNRIPSRNRELVDRVEQWNLETEELIEQLNLKQMGQ